MIQWLILASAVSANNNARHAREAAEQLNGQIHNNNNANSQFVIIHDFDLVNEYVKKPKKFLDYFGKMHKVIAKQPSMKVSLHRKDILHLKEAKDDAGNPYVVISISEYAQVYNWRDVLVGALLVPGTLEEAISILGEV